MKKKTRIFLLLLLPLLADQTLLAQSMIICEPHAANSFTTQYSGQNADCWRLRQDFVPTVADCVLTVNVSFFVFAPSDTLVSGPGTWGTNTRANAEHLIASINQTFANLSPPHLQVPGITSITDTKIRFKVKNFYMIYDDLYYAHANKPETVANYAFGDCDAINIFYTATTNTITTTTSPSGVVTTYTSWGQDGAHTNYSPGKYIFFAANGLYFGINRLIDNFYDMGSAAHELGHALGLNHPATGQGSPVAKADIAGGCCDLIKADDVVVEPFHSPPRPGDIFGATGPCNWNNVPNFHPNYSNNIMGNNSSCRTYLSPYQIAIMHYHLRTDMKEVLTSQGYKNAMTANHALDRDVTTTDAWSTDRYIKGNLTIKSGVALYIDCNVAMTLNGRIIVEPGAQLIVENGAKITNISGHMWAGIQVGGTYNKNQSMGAYGHANFQGVLRLNLNAELSHAENAVTNYLTDANDNIIWSSIGGIVQASRSSFINNTRDVEFLTYTAAPSASRFDYCKFITNGQIGKTLAGGFSQPLFRVSLWGINDVKFRNCNFENTAGTMYADNGIGIFGGDASYSVDKTGNGPPSTFKNFKTGIKVLNTNPLKVVSVNRTVFSGNTEDAVYYQNMNNMAFEGNDITANGSNGMYLTNCKDYSVLNNSFKDNSGTMAGTGMFIHNSVDGSHLVYRNTYSNMAVGIGPIGNNSSLGNNTTGLKMNCNTFKAVPNDYDIAMFKDYNSGAAIAPTVMRYQGKMSTPYYFASDAVRNIYGATGCSGCEKQWYIEGTSVRSVNHPVTTDANQQPLPQPDKSDVAVMVINTGLPFNYLTDCPYNPLSNGGGVSVDPPSPGQRLVSTQKYLPGLLDNNADGDNQFEIGATLATQLNLFLSDSVLQNADSVIAIINKYAEHIPDADVLSVYAQMHKGDLEKAQALVENMGSGDGWAALLSKQIEWQAAPEQLYNIKHNRSAREFLEPYASDDTVAGYFAARSILQLFTDGTFTDQRPMPSGAAAARLMQQQAAATAGENIITTLSAGIKVYPNPASDLVTLAYENTGGQPLQVILTDALGRQVYNATARPGEKLDISLAGLPEGVYILNAYIHKTSVYQTKVICIK